MRQRSMHAGRLIRPVIIAERCVGCKTCIRHCKSKVLAYDRATQKIRTKDSSGCLLECRTCARLCPTGAVTFSDEEAFVIYLKKRLDRIRHDLVHIGYPLPESGLKTLS
ncbi:MAG TPA: 4Fe-4S dicluster domain-containing protein [Geobacteraceae bacterium]